MALDPQLLDILACPEDKGPLLYFESEDALYNPRLKRKYAIKDDIPIMLIDEAEGVDETEHQRLLAKAEAGASSPSSRPERRGRAGRHDGDVGRHARVPRTGRAGREGLVAADRPADARRDRERRRAGHGRQRYRRRHHDQRRGTV